ncbi:MAG: AAA family ATPase [bacterium]|nr:AAA family ATPase [Acidimicrobiia bacterium]MCY4650620.1 AAA family ATPase [bacterium]
MDTLKTITVRDYRCFAGSQTARLAPLTLLVGDNSTGKTSLMAMLRAMLDIVNANRVPDFKKPPYDLGSFTEIVHRSGARRDPPDRFSAVLEVTSQTRATKAATVATHVDFADYLSAPVPIRRRISQGKYWVEQRFNESDGTHITYGSPRGAWADARDRHLPHFPGRYSNEIPTLDFPLWVLRRVLDAEQEEKSSIAERFRPLEGSPPISPEDVDQIRKNLAHARTKPRLGSAHAGIRGLFASAPVRSQPKRTYDPALGTPDPEGDYVPMYLAQLALREPQEWGALKSRIQEFGSQAGLFNEIEVKRFGEVESAPFQIRLRKAGKQRKGPMRNLVDWGYGVSQVLPLITELLRQDAPQLMLLQQPEVHLHPSAAAALGSLLSQTVGYSTRGRKTRQQIVLETHSDFIIDRVRMAVRDNSAGLRPEDVSILYFKRNEQAVQIHSISVDRLGNIDSAPAGYRKFFMEELRRSMSA